ncbi:hypothetical protein POM88_034547 [Heracleum sosnowskyi]|uniref:phosphoribosylaminoimidazole carboxylase n=1 Tax=Heracleum sosnowskyi TaxID=360622 RepID=A0AAD8HLQ3_9APIA|nr:hypothetical protein POM88_034547 [Heracleum sosnowskyi]
MAMHSEQLFYCIGSCASNIIFISLTRALKIPRADKPEMRKQRKMGHPSAAPRVGIIMGSDSDLPVMKVATKILNEFGKKPRGVPLATIAINNATNAGLLAVRMLGVGDANLHSRYE